MNRWITAAVGSVLGLVVALPTSPVSAAEDPAPDPGRCGSGVPAFGGSFIQPDLVDGWTDAKLDAEMRALRKACIREQIIQWTADTGVSPATRVYPSAEAPQSTETDVVGRILAAARRHGIKVYLGLQTNNDWWQRYANDESWLRGEATAANRLADDLRHRYASYGSTIAGWYLSFEVDNWNFPTSTTWDRMASFYRTVGGHLHQLTPGMPVVISPFYNTSGGLSAADWADMWRHILPGSHIDVVALQDGVGAGHAVTGQLPEWFGATRTAIDDASPSTRLWADTETFTPSASGFITMPTAHVVADMRAEQPYVDHYWSFSYDHYYSPVVVQPAYDATYRDYLETGSVDSQAPTAPTGLIATATGPQTVALQWQPATDEIGVTRYRIYRGGTLVRQLAALDPAACDHGNGCRAQQLRTPVTYTDAQLDPGQSYRYTVVAEDAAGNTSPASGAAAAVTSEAPATPVVVSRSSTYSCSLPASPSYGDDGAELTDGVLGTTSFTDPAWAGRLTGSPFSCTLDLGSVTTVNEVRSRWLQDPGTGIVIPASVDVEVSTDGQAFTPLGTMSAPSLGDAPTVATYRLLGVSADARFVRLTVNPTGAGWSFTDEFEVRRAS